MPLIFWILEMGGSRSVIRSTCSNFISSLKGTNEPDPNKYFRRFNKSAEYFCERSAQENNRNWIRRCAMTVQFVGWKSPAAAEIVRGPGIALGKYSPGVNFFLNLSKLVHVNRLYVGHNTDLLALSFVHKSYRNLRFWGHLHNSGNS